MLVEFGLVEKASAGYALVCCQLSYIWGMPIFHESGLTGFCLMKELLVLKCSFYVELLTELFSNQKTQTMRIIRLIKIK